MCCLVVLTFRIKEDSDAKCDLMNCRGLTQEVPEEKNINMWPRDHDILVKNVASFLPWSK